MAKNVYPFFKLPNEPPRPWVPVLVTNVTTGKSLIVMALLDTGADKCLFPKTIADQLGVADFKADAISTDEMQGVGENKIPVWVHRFKIDLMSPDRKTTVWKGKEVDVACVEHNNIPAILGFNNFMTHFKITFNHATKKILMDDCPII